MAYFSKLIFLVKKTKNNHYLFKTHFYIYSKNSIKIIFEYKIEIWNQFQFDLKYLSKVASLSIPLLLFILFLTKSGKLPIGSIQEANIT